METLKVKCSTCDSMESGLIVIDENTIQCGDCVRKTYTTRLVMKYFVLNPRSKSANDLWAHASRAALQAFAIAIRKTNPLLAHELVNWSLVELELAGQLPVIIECGCEATTKKCRKFVTNNIDSHCIICLHEESCHDVA